MRVWRGYALGAYLRRRHEPSNQLILSQVLRQCHKRRDEEGRLRQDRQGVVVCCDFEGQDKGREVTLERASVISFIVKHFRVDDGMSGVRCIFESGVGTVLP